MKKRKSRAAVQRIEALSRGMLDVWLHESGFERNREEAPPPPINRAIARAIRMAVENSTIYSSLREDEANMAIARAIRRAANTPLLDDDTNMVGAIQEAMRWIMPEVTAMDDGRPRAERDAARLALVGMGVIENDQPDPGPSRHMPVLAYPRPMEEECLYGDTAIYRLGKVADLADLDPNVSKLCRTVHRGGKVSAEQIHEALDRLEGIATPSTATADSVAPTPVSARVPVTIVVNAEPAGGECYYSIGDEKPIRSKDACAILRALEKGPIRGLNELARAMGIEDKKKAGAVFSKLRLSLKAMARRELLDQQRGRYALLDGVTIQVN